MKQFIPIVSLLIMLISCTSQERQVTSESLYLQNRAPLRANPYLELPLGSISPEGWLKEMLVRQKEGSTGQLDALYPKVMGPRNGWLGGDGDQWERGPYWIDGLLPLAYILDDKELIEKTRPWIEWALNSQQPDGYFGPSTDYPGETGLQRNNSRDWWPKMVMLKILRQYHSATGDGRVVELFDKYFRYQLKELPNTPLGHWTFWGEFRACDNLMNVYWLYNLTGESYLLELAELIHQQSFDFTGSFQEGSHLPYHGSLHCVNLAQGIKEPMVYYQQNPDPKFIEATKTAFADIHRFHGQPQGLYGGDEALHGKNPTQGSELCSAVEMMFSLETMLAITGDVQYADHLEKIAYNALPSQISDDFMTRQYFQQPNQVMLTRSIRNFDVNHDGTDVVFGLLTGYPCCTSNMHQGWPKFTQNLFYATPDNGLAALVYGPGKVTARVADDTEVTISEKTNYPFEENILFEFSFAEPGKVVEFPFHLRLPEWCKDSEIKINGQTIPYAHKDRIVALNRPWSTGDQVELILPMEVSVSTWYENSKSVERGPLVYGLKIGEKWDKVANTKDPEIYGDEYFEVRPTTPWNYGLPHTIIQNPAEGFKVVKKEITGFPWNMENAPIEITTKGIRMPFWEMYHEMVGPLPWSNMYKPELGENPMEEEITLIPYGCTTLRVSEFPVIGR